MTSPNDAVAAAAALVAEPTSRAAIVASLQGLQGLHAALGSLIAAVESATAPTATLVERVEAVRPRLAAGLLEIAAALAGTPADVPSAPHVPVNLAHAAVGFCLTHHCLWCCRPHHYGASTAEPREVDNKCQRPGAPPRLVLVPVPNTAPAGVVGWRDQ